MAAPQSASRTAAHLTAQALTVLARRNQCPASRESVSLARTPPARLPVRAPDAKAAPAKAVLAKPAAAKAAAAAQSQASRQAQARVPRGFPRDTVLAHAVLAHDGRPAPTMAQPPVPCPLGQNLIPRCPAVQFLVGRYSSAARYLAARSPAVRSRAGPGLRSGVPARRRRPEVRLPIWRSAGVASIPASTARTPAAESAQPNRPSLVPHRAASPSPASRPTAAQWTGSPEVMARQTGSPRTGRLRLGFPTAASPGLRGRAQAASARTALARTALSQTGPLRAVASLASSPGHRPQPRRPLEVGQRLPRTAPHQTVASAATTVR
jgi:hypothetical protein